MLGYDWPRLHAALNDLPVAELARILRRYGEEPFAGPIACIRV